MAQIPKGKKRFVAAAKKAKVAAKTAAAEKTYPLFQDRPEVLPDWKPGTAATITTLLEISISCRDLANKDLLSKSDPICAVFYRPPVSKKWVPLMRTEMIEDTLDPDFVRKACIEYRFERVQQIRFEVYDVDSEFTDKLNWHDSLGYIETTVGHIVTAGDSGLEMELTLVKSILDTNKGPSKIILRAEEVPSEKDEVNLKLAGYSCGTWFLVFPPKVCYAIYKNTEAGRFVITHRSKIVRGPSPSWPMVKLSLREFCSKDYDRELRIDVFQKKSRQGLVLIGSVLTTLNKLLVTKEKMQLMDIQGNMMKSFVKVVSCSVSPATTFMDYLKQGTRLHCIYAIDFTCSNGDPSDLQSLHFVSPTNPNVYEQAVQAVGNILMNYDQLNLFPAYGFGARIPPMGVFSDDFPLTLDDMNHNCFSLNGVIENYRKCLKECQLYGPTNFAPIIRRVTKMAMATKFGLDYFVLVMVTDGVITDLQMTKKAIVEASAAPMSIIIVGVGEADFDTMEELDGDGVRVHYRGRRALRDIVQFVPYRSSRNWLSATGEPTELDLEIPTEPGEEDPDNFDGGSSQREVSPARTYDEENEEESEMDGISTVEIEVPPAAEPASIWDDGDGDGEKDNKTTPSQLAMGFLAREVLSEIPEQIMAYMQLKHVSLDTVKNGLVKERNERIKAKKERIKQAKATGRPTVEGSIVMEEEEEEEDEEEEPKGAGHGSRLSMLKSSRFLSVPTASFVKVKPATNV